MNRRVFIEKRPAFDHLSQSGEEELRVVDNNIESKVFIVYDIFNLSDEEFSHVAETVFADPVMDILHNDLPDLSDYSSQLAVEFLPGQFDQRADSAEQAVQLITGNNNVKIRSAILYAFKNLAKHKMEEVKKYLINSVDAREKNMN